MAANDILSEASEAKHLHRRQKQLTPPAYEVLMRQP